MRRFLEYLLRRRANAITATAGFAALAPIFALFCYVSGAVVSVATLRYGWRDGLVIITGAAAILGGLAYLVLNSMIPAVLMLCVTWLPVWALSAVLRISSSQGIMLTVAGTLGIVVVIGFRVFASGGEEWWRSVLDEVVAKVIGDLSLEPTAKILEQVDQILDLLAPLMTGLLISVVLLLAILTSMLGRWWHAILDNPGGFGKEFRSLRLDQRVGWAALAVGLIGGFAGRNIATAAQEILCVTMILYLFQGLAVAHGVVARTGASVGWLVGLYVLLGVATPQMVMLLALVGFLDTWVNVRGRVGAARTG